MKFLILAFFLVITLSFCNSVGPTINNDSLVNEPAFVPAELGVIDSSTLVILFITHGGAPKGGKFSGHPAIRSNGSVDLAMLSKDSSRKKNDCEVKVRYTYARGRDSFVIVKDICLGSLARE